MQELLDFLEPKLLAKTLRTIIKKLQKTPTAENELARKYKADYDTERFIS